MFLVSVSSPKHTDLTDEMVGLAERAQQVNKLLADLNRDITHLRREQLWKEQFAIHSLGYHKVSLVGQAFFVLELAQHPLLRALVAACERGYLRAIGRGIKLVTAYS
jgi:hypothetical protein